MRNDEKRIELVLQIATYLFILFYFFCGHSVTSFATGVGSDADQPFLSDRELKIRTLAKLNCGSNPRADLFEDLLEIYDQYNNDFDFNKCVLSKKELDLHRATLYAASCAYDMLPRTPITCAPQGYKVLRGYNDNSGFWGVAFEKDDGSGQRIYAIAGTHVFGRVDLRGWMSGLSMAEAQATGPAAEQMIRDASWHARNGHEVTFTGQSQGGIVAQTSAYFAQVNLEKFPKSGKVNFVTWGVTGGKEVTKRIIQKSNGELPAYDEKTTENLKGVGYFFDTDYFARVGTFMGQSRVFPALYAFSPDEKTYAEQLGLGTVFGFDKIIEGHFLTAFKRASRKGGLCVTDAKAPPEKWDWVTRQAEWIASFAENVTPCKKNAIPADFMGEAIITAIREKCPNQDDFACKMRVRKETASQYRNLNKGLRPYKFAPLLPTDDEGI